MIFGRSFLCQEKNQQIPLMSLLTLDFYFNRTSQDLVESLHTDAMINALSSQNALWSRVLQFGYRIFRNYEWTLSRLNTLSMLVMSFFLLSLISPINSGNVIVKKIDSEHTRWYYCASLENLLLFYYYHYYFYYYYHYFGKLCW